MGKKAIAHGETGSEGASSSSGTASIGSFCSDNKVPLRLIAKVIMTDMSNHTNSGSNQILTMGAKPVR